MFTYFLSRLAPGAQRAASWSRTSCGQTTATCRPPGSRRSSTSASPSSRSRPSSSWASLTPCPGGERSWRERVELILICQVHHEQGRPVLRAWVRHYLWRGLPCNFEYCRNENSKCCSGLCIDLLRKFEEDIGFTYSLTRVEDPKWGTLEVLCLKESDNYKLQVTIIFQNGKWNGLMATLVNRRTDMVISALKVGW